MDDLIPHADGCEHCGRARRYRIASLCIFSPESRARVEELASSPHPPRRWLDGRDGLFRMTSRAWFEWHARRGRHWRGKAGTFSRPGPSKSLRARVLARDGLVCQLCGEPVERHDVHLDHRIPFASGGPTTADNLRVTHSQCNLRRRA